jgi:cystathionine beta-lyase/cystathionine gamma-synthase
MAMRRSHLPVRLPEATFPDDRAATSDDGRGPHFVRDATMPLGFDTQLVRVRANGVNQPLSEPIVLATTYSAPSAVRHREMFQDGSTTFYRRFGNPTAAAAARLIADLEGAEEGIVFGSGMGGISMSLFAILRAGDHVIASREVFAQTKVLLDTTLRGYGVETEFVDARVASNVTSRMRPDTRLIYVETPSNPLLHIVDIAAIAKALKPGIELYVDATFGSPALQSPIKLGATLSLHSATKFLGGHSDVLAAWIGRRELIPRIRDMQILLTRRRIHAAWLLMRGVRTLGVRVRRQAERPSPSRADCRRIRWWSPCSIRTSRVTRAMRSPRSRCLAAVASCRSW